MGARMTGRQIVKPKQIRNMVASLRCMGGFALYSINFRQSIPFFFFTFSNFVADARKKNLTMWSKKNQIWSVGYQNRVKRASKVHFWRILENIRKLKFWFKIFRKGQFWGLYQAKQPLNWNFLHPGLRNEEWRNKKKKRRKHWKICLVLYKI